MGTPAHLVCALARIAKHVSMSRSDSRHVNCANTVSRNKSARPSGPRTCQWSPPRICAASATALESLAPPDDGDAGGAS